MSDREEAYNKKLDQLEEEEAKNKALWVENQQLKQELAEQYMSTLNYAGYQFGKCNILHWDTQCISDAEEAAKELVKLGKLEHVEGRIYREVM